MTEFLQTLRRRCRNPRCRMRLKVPVQNSHKAFCTPGCHSSFYLKRCIVCEKEKPAGSTTRRVLCRAPKCESTYRQNRTLYSFQVSDTASAANVVKNVAKTGIKSGDTGDRAWCIVAGPVITANVYHCTTVPDGEYERIEAKNRGVLSAATERRPKCLSSPGTISDWKPCLPSDWRALQNLPVPDFLRRIPKMAAISSKLIPELPKNAGTPDFICAIIIPEHITNISSVALST